jgi:hypothetical protein
MGCILNNTPYQLCSAPSTSTRRFNYCIFIFRSSSCRERTNPVLSSGPVLIGTRGTKQRARVCTCTCRSHHGAGAHSEHQAPWVEQRPPSVLMAHGLRSNQGRHIPYCHCSITNYGNSIEIPSVFSPTPSLVELYKPVSQRSQVRAVPLDSPTTCNRCLT